MPRDTFINDNLINIRDRLRKNYETMKSPLAGEPSQDSPSGEIHLDLKNPLIQSTPSGGRSADREFNEFAGKLEHDLAAVAAELDAANTRKAVLEKFYSQLQDTAQDLNRLKADEPAAFFRELDRLRLAYFHNAGTAAPFRNNPTPLPFSAEPEKKQQAPSRNILLSLAVLLGALLVSLTLFILFA